MKCVYYIFSQILAIILEEYISDNTFIKIEFVQKLFMINLNYETSFWL